MRRTRFALAGAVALAAAWIVHGSMQARGNAAAEESQGPVAMQAQGSAAPHKRVTRQVYSDRKSGARLSQHPVDGRSPAA